METKELLLRLAEYNGEVESLFERFMRNKLTKKTYLDLMDRRINQKYNLIEKFKKDLLNDFLGWAINNDYIEFDHLLSIPEDVNVTMDIAEKLIKEYLENNKK